MKPNSVFYTLIMLDVLVILATFCATWLIWSVVVEIYKKEGSVKPLTLAILAGTQVVILFFAGLYGFESYSMGNWSYQ